MHSSRMRTARSSSRRGCTWSWGVYLVLEGVPSPGGCTWFWGVSAPGGVPGSGGCTWSWGVSAPRGVYLVKGGVPGLGGYLLLRGCLLPGGGCLLRGVSAPRGCTWSGTPPVDRHTPVNILPRPKLRLRAVIIQITLTVFFKTS